jgi:hypothetical protein
MPSFGTTPLFPAEASQTGNITLDTSVPDISFKAVVESFAEEHDVLFVPTDRKHPDTGLPLFKFGGGSAKRTALLFIDHDVPFVKQGEEWVPMDLDTLLENVAT